MAELETKSAIAKAIEAHYQKIQTPQDWPVLRCSKIGADCARELWYDLHWATTLRRHEGRMERLFQTGHLGESRMIADLRAIGIEVQDVDPETGKQWAVSFLDGHFKGSCDGKGWHIPGADPDECFLLEFKTHNKKSFEDWKRHGVQFAKPQHYSQMIIYMLGLGIKKGLYVANCKDDDRVDTEIIEFDAAHAEHLLAKAALILNSSEPPERYESFACRWCRHKPVCLEGAWPRATCRSCIDFSFGPNGTAFCNLHSHDLSFEMQKTACQRHISLPSMVPHGQVVTADENARTVSYQFPDGTVFVDGRDLKTAAPEVE